MELVGLSRWNLFLHSSDKNKAINIVKQFLKQNEKIKPTSEIEYSDYRKLEGVKVSFTCHHTAPSWPELVYDLILTTQISARELILTGSIKESIDIFSNNVYGVKGAVRALGMVCTRVDYPGDL